MRSTTESEAATGKPASRKYFDRDEFELEFFSEQSRKLRDIYVALDDDALTTPEQMDCYYEHADKIRDVLADGDHDVRCAKTDAQAKKIAATLAKTVDAMITGYRKAEAKRAKEAPKLEAKRKAQRDADELEAREAAIEQFPELIGRDDLLVTGNYVWTCEPLTPIKPPTKKEIAEWDRWYEKVERDRGERHALQAKMAKDDAEFFAKMAHMNEDGSTRTEAEMAEAEAEFWAKSADSQLKGELNFWTERRASVNSVISPKPRPIPKPASKPAARTMAVKFKRSFFRGR